MLVLFDLDDTLIDTTTMLVEPRLGGLLDLMNSMGAGIKDADKALETFERISRTAPSSREALGEFCFLYKIKDEILNACLEQLSNVDLSDVSLQLVTNSEKILYDLKSLATLVLVTKGEEAFQQAKMKKAGLPYSLFSKIEVTQFSKKNCYETILKEFKVAPSKAIVVADKVDDDLIPAKELGMVTVLYRTTRNRFHILPELCVDYVIEDMAQLYPIVEERC